MKDSPEQNEDTNKSLHVILHVMVRQSVLVISYIICMIGALAVIPLLINIQVFLLLPFTILFHTIILFCMFEFGTDVYFFCCYFPHTWCMSCAILSNQITQSQKQMQISKQNEIKLDSEFKDVVRHIIYEQTFETTDGSVNNEDVTITTITEEMKNEISDMNIVNKSM